MQFVRSDWVVVSISLWFLIACLISCFVIYIDRLASLGGVSVFFLSFFFFAAFSYRKSTCYFLSSDWYRKFKMGYCINFNIYYKYPPPLSPVSVEDLLLFSTTPWRLNEIFTPEDFHKIWVSPWKSFVKIKASSPKNSILFYSTLKKSSIYNLQLKNAISPYPGGGGGRRDRVHISKQMQ